MLCLDNWLAQRAADLPRPLRADRRRHVAHLRRARARGDRGRPPARRARRPPRTRPSRSTLAAGVEYVVLLHALMKLGAVAYPVNTRLADAELEAELDARPARR